MLRVLGASVAVAVARDSDAHTGRSRAMTRACSRPVGHVLKRAPVQAARQLWGNGRATRSMHQLRCQSPARTGARAPGPLAGVPAPAASLGAVARRLFRASTGLALALLTPGMFVHRRAARRSSRLRCHTEAVRGRQRKGAEAHVAAALALLQARQADRAHAASAGPAALARIACVCGEHVPPGGCRGRPGLTGSVHAGKMVSALTVRPPGNRTPSSGCRMVTWGAGCQSESSAPKYQGARWSNACNECQRSRVAVTTQSSSASSIHRQSQPKRAAVSFAIRGAATRRRGKRRSSPAPSVCQASSGR